MAPKLLDHSGGTHVIKCLLSLRCVCYTTKCVDIVNKRVGERGGRKATLLNVATTSVSKWSRTGGQMRNLLAFGTIFAPELLGSLRRESRRPTCIPLAADKTWVLGWPRAPPSFSLSSVEEQSCWRERAWGRRGGTLIPSALLPSFLPSFLPSIRPTTGNVSKFVLSLRGRERGRGR